jgi:hypothetical protein
MIKDGGSIGDSADETMSHLNSIDHLSISINGTENLGQNFGENYNSSSGQEMVKIKTSKHSPGSKTSSASPSSHKGRTTELGQQGKPQYSYAMMIKFAIQSHPAQQMTLNDIYSWITEKFPYYKTAAVGWKVVKWFIFFHHDLVLADL